MTHLNEEQIIDALMGKHTDQAHARHLDSCTVCRERLMQQKLGLRLAIASKPRVPLMPVPHVSYTKLKRGTMRARMAWIAAAAMLLLSLGGFRLEVSGNGLAFQFGLPGLGSGAQATRIAQLENDIQVLQYARVSDEQQMQAFMAGVEEHMEDGRILENNVSHKVQALGDMVSLTMQLTPEELGKLKREKKLTEELSSKGRMQ